MKPVRICFLWHIHQPYYTDPVAGSASMPWVRLHATKAYFDMAWLAERFPTVRATFNLTPSLLIQLKELAAGSVQDLFLEHTKRPAAELTTAERAFLLRHFFAANWRDRKSTRLNSSHLVISYAVFCLKKKKTHI